MIHLSGMPSVSYSPTTIELNFSPLGQIVSLKIRTGMFEKYLFPFSSGSLHSSGGNLSLMLIHCIFSFHVLIIFFMSGNRDYVTFPFLQQVVFQGFSSFPDALFFFIHRKIPAL